MRSAPILIASSRTMCLTEKSIRYVVSWTATETTAVWSSENTAEMPRYSVWKQPFSTWLQGQNGLGKSLTYCESRSEMSFFLHERAHLTLTVHRSARGELTALFEGHDR